MQNIDKYRIKLKFNNGAEGVVDLAEELYGEVFEPLKDIELFKSFFLTSRTIEWPSGADFAPEYLFEVAKLTPVFKEDQHSQNHLPPYTLEERP
ncbi:MAG: DUF2442 domain-containing protein [Caldilineaceae bacterium]|nr:DUF2442 domain-containing protein [Caldilineaceae bacterium]MCB0095040.1 DUF2442 domain-containing protein [Caldilineaceae bacterium]MCB0142075.1 DUF2442 domain-containing protein [Caldilineaceae bacterium]